MGATIVPFSEKVAPITTRTFMVLIQFTNVHVHLHSEIQTPHFYSLEQTTSCCSTLLSASGVPVLLAGILPQI